MIDFNRVRNDDIACGYTDMRKQIDGLVGCTGEGAKALFQIRTLQSYGKYLTTNFLWGEGFR